MSEDAWRILGGRPLRGTVRPSGSKNGSLPLLAATLVLDGETVLHNVPRIADVQTMMALLRAVGLTVEEQGDGSVRVVNHGIAGHRAPDDLVAKMRASHYLLGPTLLRLGRAEMAMPGGCDLGARPVTHILSVLEALGAQATVGSKGIELTSKALRGAVVTLDPQHRNPGATFTGLMAASLAQGETVIENASYEPDVTCFCEFLKAAGARIEGLGGARLTVRGVDRLLGTTHRVNSDRLEAGTFICAAAATRGEVLVENITWEELGATLDKLAEAGVELSSRAGGLVARCPRRPRGVDIVTDPFPLFSTDLQPPVAAVLATAKGDSTITETVFDRRLQYVAELKKMGAEIELRDSRRAVIHGVERLRAASVAGGNIRDGAALVVAALCAEGESLVSGRQYVARGYEDFERKLRSLGAEITVAG
jgi:UDP-N-acetylglucosamine 1-carboxyvinyltransferase